MSEIKFVRDGWALDPIPAYKGGKLSEVYATGHGISMGVPYRSIALLVFALLQEVFARFSAIRKR